ncbi:hypothetical protein [Methylobacterium nonmethylotrophicum]|uniref:Uncharacterized protein n=1 Tax=Methylobacterium nonmethylotrophicum TaxID=1141884 RepID=A0A4Z0NMS7_9HYPH|nr:hypothetical protein [Methylobacterium nonmethylotrophicum]TGD97141.1 hypothetical protein EU555_20465 [Methylobacterium nonmethylotrophicum]
MRRLILPATGDTNRLAAVLAPGLHAAFDGCLSEALPAALAELAGRLDRPRASSDEAAGGPSRSMRPSSVPRAARRPRDPDSFKRS